MGRKKSIIGQTFKIENEIYQVTKEISIGRTNADIYLCTDCKNNQYAAKYYCNRIPVSVVGYSVYNHYGRGRDGSLHVFNEVKTKSLSHAFIVKHYHRINHNGSWLVIMDYVEGPTVFDFISENYQNNFEMVEIVVKQLAKTLAEWHNSDFAHGDPHLENAIFTKEQKVVLIDYGQIHHLDFKHCSKYCCIDNGKLIRIQEDFENSSNKLGNGFRSSLNSLQQELGLKNTLTRIFNDQYKAITKLDVFPDSFFN